MDVVNDDSKTMGLTREMAEKNREVWRREFHRPVNPPGRD